MRDPLPIRAGGKPALFFDNLPRDCGEVRERCARVARISNLRFERFGFETRGVLANSGGSILVSNWLLRTCGITRAKFDNTSFIGRSRLALAIQARGVSGSRNKSFVLERPVAGGLRSRRRYARQGGVSQPSRFEVLKRKTA